MLFDDGAITTTELPTKETDFVGKKCIRCGAPASGVTVVGDLGLDKPKPVYAFVCDRSPECLFRMDPK